MTIGRSVIDTRPSVLFCHCSNEYLRCNSLPTGTKNSKLTFTTGGRRRDGHGFELIRSRLEQEQRRLNEELEQLKAIGNSEKEQQVASSFRGREEAAVAASDLERRTALETQKMLK